MPKYREILKKSDVLERPKFLRKPEIITIFSFCSIMSGLEINDKNGNIEATPKTSNADIKKAIKRICMNLYFSSFFRIDSICFMSFTTFIPS